MAKSSEIMWVGAVNCGLDLHCLISHSIRFDCGVLSFNDSYLTFIYYSQIIKSARLLLCIKGQKNKTN